MLEIHDLERRGIVQPNLCGEKINAPVSYVIAVQLFHISDFFSLYAKAVISEPRHEKTRFLPRRKQRRRSASR